MSEISTEELAQWLEKRISLDHDFYQEAAARLRALAEDAERLDWLNRMDACIDQIEGESRLEVVNHWYFYGGSIREAIDKARHD